MESSAKERRPRLAVIEDSPGLARLLRRGLADVAEVHVAHDLAAATALLERRHFHIVVLDVRLGEERDAGLRLLALVSQLHPEARVLVLSGNSAPSVAASVRLAGASFLQKPAPIRLVREFVTAKEEARTSFVDLLMEQLDELRREADLTSSDVEVLVSLACGETRAEVVTRLHISDQSLRKQISAMLTKISKARGRPYGSLERVLSEVIAESALADVDATYE